jgi:hypothetical protein
VKLKTDAQDENLTGKVKSVIEEFQESVKSKRMRESEKYFNESGNLIKEVNYLEGYPESVMVWGYIDGNRVFKSNDIQYAKGERPAFRGIMAKAEDNAKDPNAPKDRRYSMSYKYQYNEKGQLTEKRMYQNNGELWSRNVYQFNGNQRINIDYGNDNSEWSRTVEVLDKNGDVIETYQLDENGKPDSQISYTYKYDSNENWIIKSGFENKKVKGRTVLKPYSIVHRIITYYF